MTASIKIPDRQGHSSDPWSVPRGSAIFNQGLVQEFSGIIGKRA